MALHEPTHEVELRHDADRVAAIADHFAVALHRGDAPLERSALALAHFQKLRELAFGHGHAVLVEDRQDVLAAGQRLFVAFALALVVRIARAPAGLRRRAPHAAHWRLSRLALRLSH